VVVCGGGDVYFFNEKKDEKYCLKLHGLRSDTPALQT
jgi:hypothetical protein